MKDYNKFYFVLFIFKSDFQTRFFTRGDSYHLTTTFFFSFVGSTLYYNFLKPNVGFSNISLKEIVLHGVELSWVEPIAET